MGFFHFTITHNAIYWKRLDFIYSWLLMLIRQELIPLMGKYLCNYNKEYQGETLGRHQT